MKRYIGGNLQEFAERHGAVSKAVAAEIALQVLRRLEEGPSRPDLSASNILLLTPCSGSGELEAKLNQDDNFLRFAASEPVEAHPVIALGELIKFLTRGNDSPQFDADIGTAEEAIREWLESSTELEQHWQENAKKDANKTAGEVPMVLVLIASIAVGLALVKFAFHQTEKSRAAEDSRKSTQPTESELIARAEAGGFDEKLMLFDFYRARTTRESEAIETGRALYRESEDAEMPARVKIARQLWDHYREVEELEWLAENHNDPVRRHRLRWKYFEESGDRDYADAAKHLAQSEALPPEERAKFAWLYFETLSLEQRKTAEALLFLQQAGKGGINEALVYEARSRQIEESRIAVEEAQKKAAEAVAVAKRIDMEMKRIDTLSMVSDGKFDENAFRNRMGEYTKLLDQAQSVSATDRSRIFWTRFLTWEEAVGLRARSLNSSRPEYTVHIDENALRDLETAEKLGHPEATARLATIFAGIYPLKPPKSDYKRAASFAAKAYQRGGSGVTEATLVLRHLLSGTMDMRETTSQVLKSMNIPTSDI